VPAVTLKKAIAYLDSAAAADEGYAYVPQAQGASRNMTAAGLMCRQSLQSWGPAHPRYVKAVDKYLKANPPGKQPDVYHFYYATQVMYNAGGKDWQNWNEPMRDSLVKTQDNDDKSPTFGS
jgi:hypothetical protein